MERDCESELSKLNIEQNACIYHFGASVIHGQRSNILRLPFSKIGNNVYIGTSARILGNITIADNVVIGANAVVTKSIAEPGITVAGIPAKKSVM